MAQVAVLPPPLPTHCHLCLVDVSLLSLKVPEEQLSTLEPHRPSAWPASRLGGGLPAELPEEGARARLEAEQESMEPPLLPLQYHLCA